MEGEGSAGSLDLFANVVRGSDTGFWHTRALARLSLGVKIGRRRHGKAAVTVSVLDAGDPVAGAQVRVGRRRARTDAGVKLRFKLR